MPISEEPRDQYSIQAYSETEIKIDSMHYQHSLIVSNHGIFTDWPITKITNLNEQSLAPLLAYKPKVIIIGHNQLGQLAPFSTMAFLSKQQIGLECMSIGAACRTFNVLLSERREVVLGILLDLTPCL